MPIPPYIAKFRPSDANDHQDYQTVFARNEGSVAAPTAGLHFTDRLIDSLKTVKDQSGICHPSCGCRHVSGLTRRPLKPGSLHQEWCESVREVAQKISADQTANGGRVIAVGTTALRTLEGRSITGGDSGQAQVRQTFLFSLAMNSGLSTGLLPTSTFPDRACSCWSAR